MSIFLDRHDQFALTLRIYEKDSPADGAAPDALLLVNPMADQLNTLDTLKPKYVLLTHVSAPQWDVLAGYNTKPGTIFIVNEALAEVITANNIAVDIISMPTVHSMTFDWGELHSVECQHQYSINATTSNLAANGFIVEALGNKIYIAGPAAFSEQFKEIGREFKPAITVLPCGGYDEQELVRTALWLGSDFLIPDDMSSPKGDEALSPQEIYTTLDLYTPVICRYLEPGDTYEFMRIEATGRTSGPESGY